MNNYDGTSKTLVQELRKNKHSSSWDQFCNIYQPYIYTIVKNLGIKHHDIEDLVQTVFFKAWKNIDSIRYKPGKGAFRSWIRSIARNTTLTFINKNKRSVGECIDDLYSLGGVLLIYEDENENEDEEWREFISKKAWENIKTDFSELVLKIFIELLDGGSINKIANKYNIKENTVYQYRGRVKDRLYQEIRRLSSELS